MAAPSWLVTQGVLAAASLLCVLLSGVQVWGERLRERVPRPRQVIVRASLAGSALQLVRSVDPWGLHGVLSPEVTISMSNFVSASVFAVMGAASYQVTLAAEAPVGVTSGAGGGSASVRAAAVASTGLVIAFAAGCSAVSLFAREKTVAVVSFQVVCVLALLLLNALTLKGVARVSAEVRGAVVPVTGVHGNAAAEEYDCKMTRAVTKLWRLLASMSMLSALAVSMCVLKVSNSLARGEEAVLVEDPHAPEPGTMVIALCQVAALFVGVLFAWVPLRRRSAPVALAPVSPKDVA